MANPTIGATTPRIQYTATASQTVFTVPFEFLANADLAVYVNGTLKTLTTDYTLTGANTTGGGALTFVTGRTAGDIVTILGNLAYSRDTNKYTKYGLLPAEVLEADFDAMQVQAKQLARDGQFALRAPLTDTGSPTMTLPAVATRASKALGFDASGNPTVSASSLADIDSTVQIIDALNALPAGSSASVSYQPSGTGAVITTVQAKLRETVSVKDFGAVGDGTTDDTAAIQAAINASNFVHFPAGTYKVVTSSTASFTYGNAITNVYVALNINKSNLTITSDNAVIDLYAASAASGAIVYAFATDKNMTLGTLSNISISGLKFEFNPTGKTAATYRSISIIGCRGISLNELFLYSSGSRYGATITLQNSEQVRFSNIKMRNVTQGMNFSYVDDVQFSNIMLDYFSEGIDFDRMVSRCTATNVNFVSTFGTASGQCWDLNSVRDSTFKNITAYNCGNVVYINFKQTTPPTYADYVNNAAITVYTPSRNVTVDGVKIHTCGQGGAVFYIGDDANTDPDVLTRDVIITNVDMIDSGGFEVRSAINVTLENITCINAYPNLSAGFALFFILKGSRTNAKASAKLKNIKVKGVATSQDVIRISEADSCLMDGLHIENYPVDAVEISSPTVGSHYSITNSKFLRTVDTTVTGVALRMTSITTESVQFDWFNNIITQYTTAIVLGNNTAGRILPCNKISLGQQVYTSGTKRTEVYSDKNKTAYFGEVLLSALTAAADGTNYVSYNLRNTGTSVCSGTDTGGITSGTPFAIGFSTPESFAEVDPTEVMYLEATATGTGRTLDAFAISAYMIEYLKV